MPKCRHLICIGLIAALVVGRSAGAGGPLQEVSREAGLGDVAAVGAMGVDYDRDGAVDLLLAARGQALTLYRNRQGRFEETGLTFGRPGEEVDAAVWGDFDNDGDLDLYLVNGDGPNRLLRNEGSTALTPGGGRFTDVAGQMGAADGSGGGVGATWVDFDNDGDLDLHVINQLGPDRPGPQTATLTVQSDDPWHGEQTVLVTATALRRTGDITGDGLVDLNDFFALADGFGKRVGEQGFDRGADLNGDGRVDLEDLFVLQDAMGRK